VGSGEGRASPSLLDPSSSRSFPADPALTHTLIDARSAQGANAPGSRTRVTNAHAGARQCLHCSAWRQPKKLAAPRRRSPGGRRRAARADVLAPRFTQAGTLPGAGSNDSLNIGSAPITDFLGADCHTSLWRARRTGAELLEAMPNGPPIGTGRRPLTTRGSRMTSRCDFCCKPFSPPIWNSRTCYACSAQGAPDQSMRTFPSYLRARQKWLRSQGKLPEPKPRGNPNIADEGRRALAARRSTRVTQAPAEREREHLPPSTRHSVPARPAEQLRGASQVRSRGAVRSQALQRAHQSLVAQPHPSPAARGE
jgi:hypothetical protein